MADKERISRKKFIGLGAALGLGSLGASAIAGCSGGSSGSAGSGGTTTSGGGGEGTVEAGPEIGKGQAIAEESEVTPEAAFPFTEADTGRAGVLVRLESGDFAAYSAVCTHQACTVAYRPEEKKLACPCHGSVFDPARGAAVENGPASSPLPEVRIEVREDKIFLA